MKDPLRRDVSTGKDNPVQVKPFEVYNVRCPAKWDPSANDRLKVEYHIKDVNGKALSGRVIYSVPGLKSAAANSPEAVPIIVHKQSLMRDQITQGSHTIQQWDGVITEGLTDRKGKKVTADLSPISVRVEIWNKNTPAPGKQIGDGKTDVPGENLSSDSTTVDIDAIQEAYWNNNWCIPYDDPMEPQYGWTWMTIKVRNVLEGIPVRIRVLRIRFDKGKKKSIYDIFGEIYAETGKDPKKQEGLEGAFVRGGQVVIGDGTELPYVQWNNYKEHWKYPDENNFYCFDVAFGKRGDYIAASERDYKDPEKEKKCLHMRFTVFIHCSDPALKETLKAGRKLDSILRSKKVKYFRSYLKVGPLNKNAWLKHFRHRYIVLLLGHAGCNCEDPTHPTYDKKNKKGVVIAKDKKKDVYEEEFPLYSNKCPKKGKPDEESYGGCGSRKGMQHWIWLGVLKGKKNWLGNEMVYNWWTGRDLTWRKGKREEKKMEKIPMSKLAPPRFWLEAGVCRSLLTTNLGEYFVCKGTRFFSGWIYTAYDDVAGPFYVPLFRDWILGTDTEKPPAEYLTSRFLQAYAKYASLESVRTGGPCLIDRSCNLGPPNPPEVVRK